jgi:hypothetical protein
MNHADLRSAQALMAARRWSSDCCAEIHLDRDALNPRGWLSRRGRRLLDPPSQLLSSMGERLAGFTIQPEPPRQRFVGQGC